MKISKKVFYKEYRKHFGVLRSSQVVGLEAILEAATSYNTTVNQTAYILATVKHETANTFLPIKERGNRDYFNRMYDPVLGMNKNRRNKAKRNGNTSQGDGAKYKGRGFVQITWKNNYRRFQQLLGVDLVSDPDLALDIEIAIAILFIGMLTGVFTGKSVIRYINSDGKRDYYNARRVVNGMDKAKMISAYARKFQKCLDTAIGARDER